MTQNTFHGKIDRNVVTIGRKNMGKKTDKSTVGLILGFVWTGPKMTISVLTLHRRHIF